MRLNKHIAVVIPAHNEGRQIRRVLKGLPAWLDMIVVIDDLSTDDTAAVVTGVAQVDQRVVLLRNERNLGAGGSVARGYRHALDSGMDVIAVMDGDGQMPADKLPLLVDPVASGRCDYAKANRLASGEAWKVIPRTRYLGNAMLTFLTKIASGYYGVTDSQSGFTAVSSRALRHVDLEKIYPSYGYPNDLLVRLNVARARVCSVPTRPVYNVGEQSSMKVWRVLFTLSWLLLKRFLWRLFVGHVVRDFHPLVLFYTLGTALLTAGFAWGAFLVVALSAGNHPTGGDSALAALGIGLGGTLLMFAMLFDFENNRRLSVHAWDEPEAREPVRNQTFRLQMHCAECGETTEHEATTSASPFSRPVGLR